MNQKNHLVQKPFNQMDIWFKWFKRHKPDEAEEHERVVQVLLRCRHSRLVYLHMEDARQDEGEQRAARRACRWYDGSIGFMPVHAVLNEPIKAIRLANDGMMITTRAVVPTRPKRNRF